MLKPTWVDPTHYIKHMQLHTEEGCESVGRVHLLQGLLSSLGVVLTRPCIGGNARHHIKHIQLHTGIDLRIKAGQTF